MKPRKDSESLSLSTQFTTTLLALAGYFVLVVFPAMALALAIKLPFDLHAASKSTDYLLIALEFALFVGCAWISLDIFRLRPRIPSGQPLTRDRHTELWTQIDRACAVYGIDPVDHVVLTRHFDLNLERTPRTGFPLGHVTTLFIGLPLMQTLSAENLNVLLTRKLSQVPRAGNFPFAWIYHLRTTWYRYAREYPCNAALGHMIMALWFTWYSPLFIRLSRTCARACELQADRDLVDLFTLSDVEEAIINYSLYKSFVENKLWPALLRMASSHPQPPFLPFRSMETLVERELDADRAHRLLDGLLNSKALSDTHFPTLRMRLRAVSHNRPRVPEPSRISAARHYLPATVEMLENHMDQAWFKANIGSWTRRYQQTQADRTRLHRLIEQLPETLLSTEELWEYTDLVEQYLGSENAALLYRALLDIAPHDAAIFFKIGRFLVGCRDKSGVSALEQAMNMDGKYTNDACELISEFMHFTGERRRALTYEQRAVEYNAA